MGRQVWWEPRALAGGSWTLQAAEKVTFLYCECLLAIFRFRFPRPDSVFRLSHSSYPLGSADPLSWLRSCGNQLGQADQIRCGRV